MPNAVMLNAVMPNAVMLNALKPNDVMLCHYAECRYTECHGAFSGAIWNNIKCEKVCNGLSTQGLTMRIL